MSSKSDVSASDRVALRFSRREISADLCSLVADVAGTWELGALVSMRSESTTLPWALSGEGTSLEDGGITLSLFTSTVFEC